MPTTAHQVPARSMATVTVTTQTTPSARRRRASLRKGSAASTSPTCSAPKHAAMVVESSPRVMPSAKNATTTSTLRATDGHVAGGRGATAMTRRSTSRSSHVRSVTRTPSRASAKPYQLGRSASGTNCAPAGRASAGAIERCTTETVSSHPPPDSSNRVTDRHGHG